MEEKQEKDRERGKERERMDRSRNLDTLKPALGLY